MDSSAESITSAVRALRERAGLSMSAIAKAMGYRTPSGYQHYESLEKYSGGYIRRDVVAKLAAALEGKGNPPIEPEEVWALAGPEFLPPGGTRPEPIRDFSDPAAPEPHEMAEFSVDDEHSAVGMVDGRVVFKGQIPGSSPETASRGGAGPGQLLDDGVARVESNGIASGHVVAAEWVIPPSFVRHSLGGQPASVIIVPITGHSMEPRLEDGDRVIVDLSQNSWIGDAIYLIDDGSTVFQAKTLKKVTSSVPPRFLIISEADRDHPDERRFDEFRIVGRVVGRISKP